MVAIPIKPKSPTPSRTQYNEHSPIHLKVPYFSQRDSATDQGLRMCFSSTCAMAAAYLKPGCLDGNGQPDDCYLDRVQRHGDSTDAAAQIEALRGLGIEAELRTDGRIEQFSIAHLSDAIHEEWFRTLLRNRLISPGSNWSAPAR